MLLLVGQYAAAALFAGLVGAGVYSQFEHRKQSVAGLGVQALFWGVIDAIGVPGAFPYRSDKLTVASLDTCLREGGVLRDPSTRPVSVRRDRFSHGGFLGDMERLSVEYAGPAAATMPAKMVAKFGPADLATRVLTRVTGALTTEAEMYRNEMVQKAGIRAPTCYFAKSDRVTDRVLLLMEDLAPLTAADQVTLDTHIRTELDLNSHRLESHAPGCWAELARGGGCRAGRSPAARPLLESCRRTGAQRVFSMAAWH